RATETLFAWNPAAALWTLALVLLPLTCWRTVRAIATEDLDPVSQVWCTLADDWQRGVPYRPLLSDEGYGGTRYMPGETLLHSAALRFLPFGAAGFAVTIPALLLLLGSALGILRQVGVKGLAAAGGACLVLASLTLQYAAVSTRGELLSAALQLAG